MNKQTVLSIVLAVLLAVSVTVNIALCVLWPRGTSDVPVIDPVNTTTSTTVAKDMTDIETPYGTVKFPAAFQNVRYEPREQDGVYTLSFAYLRGEQQVELFAVHFGDEKRGTLIGYVTKDGSEIPFTVTSADAVADDAWSAQEQDDYKTLMMSVNDVIASVQTWDGFIG